MPTQYLLELFDTSGDHRPIARFTSDTPFHAVHVGDRFDDTGWDRLDGIGAIATQSAPVRYTVHSIKHLIEQGENGLRIRYCLNLEPFCGPPSPIWKD